jgi:hypothetical protein
MDLRLELSTSVVSERWLAPGVVDWLVGWLVGDVRESLGKLRSKKVNWL